MKDRELYIQTYPTMEEDAFDYHLTSRPAFETYALQCLRTAGRSGMTVGCFQLAQSGPKTQAETAYCIAHSYKALARGILATSADQLIVLFPQCKAEKAAFTSVLAKRHAHKISPPDSPPPQDIRYGLSSLSEFPFLNDDDRLPLLIRTAHIRMSNRS